VTRINAFGELVAGLVKYTVRVELGRADPRVLLA